MAQKQKKWSSQMTVKTWKKEEINQYIHTRHTQTHTGTTIICLTIHGCLSCSYTHCFCSPLCVIWSHESHMSPVSVTVCEWTPSLPLSLPSLFLIMMTPLTSHVPVCPPGPSSQSELELLSEGNPVRTLIWRLETPMGTPVEWDGILITSSEHPRQK